MYSSPCPCFPVPRMLDHETFYHGGFKVLLSHEYALSGAATYKDMQENKTLT